METMGLIIIVLLVVVGIVLLVTLGRPKDSNKETSYNEKLINSFVSTLPDVQVNSCTGNPRIKDLIRSCATEGSLCGTPCTEIVSALETILENSLVLWGYDYELGISQVDIELKSSDDGSDPCIGKRRSVLAEQPVPISASSSDPALIQLRVCFN